MILLILAASAADHAGAFGHRGDDRDRYHQAVAHVVYAADGDTVDVDLPDGRRDRTRIRLWGVDCPEIAHGPGEHDMHFGPQATAYTRARLVGRFVRLELAPAGRSRDRYGRLLAYIFREGETTTFNEELIRTGYAYADTRFGHVLQKRFQQSERAARREKRGFWRDLRAEDMPGWYRRSAGLMPASSARIP